MKVVMKSRGGKIRLSFLDASDGPRIIFFGPMDIDIGLLQGVFRLLSQECTDIQLDKQQFIIPFGGIELLAKCFSSPTRGRQSQEGVLKRVGAQRFEWHDSPEGWDNLAELIEGLVQVKAPGHQYLTRYPQQDATIVVSKGEYSDDILRR